MPVADNLIKRDFHTDAPNVKWVTDITEFSIPARKVYLLPEVAMSGNPYFFAITSAGNF